MAYQTKFERYELKYLITKEQKAKILEVMKNYMELDEYGHSTIRNIYFDTDNYRLIRRSIEGPIYKEKLRIRSYKKAGPDTKVFVELKKKYKRIVYKRRLPLPEKEAIEWVCSKKPCQEPSQISKEIEYFLNYYESIRPTLFLSYEREAFYSKDGSDFRVTFDNNIICRENDLSLETEIYGTKILDDDHILMEIKCSGGIPLWMTDILTKEHIYKTSFSKYGTAYKNIILPRLKENTKHA